MQLRQAARGRARNILQVLGSERPFIRRSDLLLLAVLPAPAVLTASGLAGGPVSRLGVVLVVTAALAVRRTMPLLSLALAAALVLSYPVLGSTMAPMVPTLVLSFLAGRRVAELWHAHAVFLGVAVAGLLLTTAFAQPKDLLSLLITEFATCVLPWWAGSWSRQRSELTRAGWERAEQLEWKQRFVAEQARLKERARIAQDIHDSLGHELSVMALLSGGLELSPGLSAEHRQTMGQLRERCTMATERLHEVIGLLREDSAPSLHPAQESIGELVRRFQRSGNPVRFREEGAESGRPPLLAELAAYRVVQEALTNATKHAPAAVVTVRVIHRADETVVSVFNEVPADDRRPTASGSGLGLIGLDERVRLAGGTLRAGPRATGFEVRAELPHIPPVPTRAMSDAPGEEPAGADVGEPVPGGAAPDDPEAPEHAQAPSWSASRAALIRARAGLRRDATRAALIPVVLGTGLVLTLAGLYVFTSAMTSVSAEDYAGMRRGETRAELAPVLPERRISKPPPVVDEPPVPPGAVCEYYRAGDGVLQFTDTLYRLCFRDDVLVAKDTL
ncbi:Signal transduction histidine kinase [Streptomyces sp. cf386]|uniref:sensor histidine kinase n=1 Tax=Streptomyces sp. cf386 TaxID=1761904 RepID=UPI0008885979|nr:histidine kinase [Streptomyces sp. cf386]SDN25357.1 Signal transduction histidine kinase [Streptomyces sp. cf386]